ncbi:MAG: hypothetical protein EOM62_09380 [Bacteroidia bacterium]|nr:hypothetical protein [Bacteroidia bacterium]
MAPSNRQPQWDIYEAVILLDGYLKALQANQPKARIVKHVSADLRRMAANRGIEIDDIYRNENGISYQIQSMDSAYKGKKVYVPATRLFEKAVEMYRTDIERYLEILEEAKNVVAAKQNNKDAFLAWATSVLPTQRCKWIEENILKVEQLAVAAKLISGSIFDVADMATLGAIYRAAGKNKIFQIKNRKFIKNINDDYEAYMQYCSQTSEQAEQADETEPSAVKTPAEPVSAVTASTEPDNGPLVVDFGSEESMAFTKPRSITFLGTELSRPSTWKDVYVRTVSALYENHPDVFSSLSSFPGSTRLEFGKTDDASRMTAPREISEELCVETNFSATDFIQRIKMLLSICAVAYDDLKIVYERRFGAVASKNASPVSTLASSACEAEFYAYLQNTAKLAGRTCSTYVSSIRSAERYAADNGYLSCSLFSEDNETTVATAAELYGDSDFIRYNEQQHNRFSAAINKLLESIGAEIPEKVVASLSGDNGQRTAPAEVNSKIVSVLKKHYEYGFKYDSIRELMRFRQFADAMGITLPEEDETLKTSILSSGAVIDDKVYCKSDDMPQELQRILDDVFSSGAGVIYYESLFEREQEWMESHVITSSDMLKEYLQKSITGCSFSKKFVAEGSRRSEKEAVTDELKRVWGSHPSESVYNLRDRLPYIPLGNIWRVISGNDLFALVSEGEYLFIDRFRITEDEEEDILDYVDGICEENGFASLIDVPLGGIEEENYELTQLAIFNAIYKKVLSGKYHLNGKILTKEKCELDAVMLLKQYIKDKDECTFDDVADKVVELTGGTNRLYAFQALYDDMVRVDRNRFVANRLVNFAIDEIDTVLAGFITDNFRAIQDVTTFAMFPLCGQSWNHYLLESFCYKYSRKYSLHVIHFNDKNAGIIAEKDFNKKYNEMLAIALARTDVELSLEVIGQYLFNTGYMAKSKYAKLGEIAQQASKLRKER